MLNSVTNILITSAESGTESKRKLETNDDKPNGTEQQSKTGGIESFTKTLISEFINGGKILKHVFSSHFPPSSSLDLSFGFCTDCMSVFLVLVVLEVLSFRVINKISASAQKCGTWIKRVSIQ